MTLVVALAVATAVVVFWRQVLALVAIVVVGLLLLGVNSLMSHDGPAPQSKPAQGTCLVTDVAAHG
jgi:hypothetical protein